MTFYKLKIPLAFICVLLIWTTTPLAIQWSSAGAPLSSASLRMLIGVVFCVVSLRLFKSNLPWSAQIRRVYMVGGLGIFISMSMFYTAAQLIPSGWIAVLFGISPLTTGLFSAMVEPETRLTFSRIVGLLLGLGGLYLVFSAGLNVQDASFTGVLLTLIAVLITSATAVVMRQLVRPLDISGMQITTGSLIVTIPLFVITASVLETPGQLELTQKTLYGILYLGLIGTGVGFTLYYFLLKHVTANRIALIALITPISALALGNWLNDEPLVAEVWIGASMVCVGLLLYEFKPRLGLSKL